MSETRGAKMRECAAAVLSYIDGKTVDIKNVKRTYGPAIFTKAFKLLRFEGLILHNVKKYPPPFHFGISKYGAKYIATHGYILISPDKS